jgi:hypothetical protein
LPSENEAGRTAGHPSGASAAIVPETGSGELEVTVTSRKRLSRRESGHTTRSGSTVSSTFGTTRSARRTSPKASSR